MSVASIFEELDGDATRPNAGLVYRRVLPRSPFDARLEIRTADRHKRFAVGSSGRSRTCPAVELRGLHVTTDPEDGRLIVELRDDRLCDLYCALVQDLVALVKRLPPTADPITAVTDRLNLWRRLFSDSGGDGLTAEEQRGLFCELLCLREVGMTALDPGDAIRMWKSPAGATQDFLTDEIAIEVKSRFRKGNTRVRISSENQLEPGSKRLFLAVYALDAGDGCSLVDLVSSILSALAPSITAQVAFSDALILYGYHEIHREHYTQPCFTWHASFFEVREGFPRIRAEDLDGGVAHVAYDLELTACVPFAVSGNMLVDALKGEYGQP